MKNIVSPILEEVIQNFDEELCELRQSLKFLRRDVRVLKALSVLRDQRIAVRKIQNGEIIWSATRQFLKRCGNPSADVSFRLLHIDEPEHPIRDQEGTELYDYKSAFCGMIVAHAELMRAVCGTLHVYAKGQLDWSRDEDGKLQWKVNSKCHEGRLSSWS